MSVVVALSETPFYEEWWFLIVMALISLILILMVVFGLLMLGQNKKYRSCGTGRTYKNNTIVMIIINGIDYILVFHLY